MPTDQPVHQRAAPTIEPSTVLVFIAHAGVRSVWSTSRMKPDDVLVECARRGGVLGIEAARTPRSRPLTTSPGAGVDHFIYCVELMGIGDHAGGNVMRVLERTWGLVKAA
jgi:membrane dipeptidase